MTAERNFVATSLFTSACALVAVGALAAGGTLRAGSDFRGEANVVLAAGAVAILGGVALVVMAVRHSGILGAASAATGACLAALAFAVPAVQAFAAGVNTPADDSFGCGSISTPAKVLPPSGSGEPMVSDTCGERLGKQKALVVVLALPALASAGLAVSFVLRGAQRHERVAA